MARTSYKVYEKQYPYFITCSIVDWLPLFSNRAAAQIILDSLTFLQKKRRFVLYAYVIMENHIHFIAQSDELEQNMRSFKSFTARAIINQMKAGGHSLYLDKFRSLKLAHHRDSEFQVWQEGYHPKQIAGDNMMNQKINYIHQNPVKRGYIDRPEHWRYSSARDYTGLRGIIPVTLV